MDFPKALSIIDGIYDFDFTEPEDTKTIVKCFNYDNLAILQCKPSNTHNEITLNLGTTIYNGIISSNRRLMGTFNSGAGSSCPIVAKIKCGAMQYVFPDHELKAREKLKGNQICPFLVLESSVSEKTEHVMARASAYLNDHTDVQAVVVIKIDTVPGGWSYKKGGNMLGRLRFWVLGRMVETDKKSMQSLWKLYDEDKLPRENKALCSSIDTSSLDNDQPLCPWVLSQMLNVRVMQNIEVIEGQDYFGIRLTLRLSELFSRCPALLALIDEDEVMIDLADSIDDIFTIFRREYL